MRRSHGPRRPETGASAVEFALVVPLLVMLLLGVTTAGLGMHNALGTTDAVREGARFGATTLTTPVPAGYASWSAAVQAKTVVLSAGSVTSDTQVCVKLQKGTSTVLQQSSCTFATSEPPNPTSITATDCIVKVWARIPVTVNIGVASWDIFVVRSSVARYERTCT
jgi:Flp pilus assembly protein TadG